MNITNTPILDNLIKELNEALSGSLYKSALPSHVSDLRLILSKLNIKSAKTVLYPHFQGMDAALKMVTLMDTKLKLLP